MKQRNGRISNYQAGFSLIEIMIGLVIGMIVSVVIVNILSTFEGQKRTTTGTADAQTNGSIALYSISRELQMAGYPLIPATNSPLECTTLTFGGTGITSITPITVTDGVAAMGVSASDTITIRYGTSPMGGIPTQISGAPTGNAVPVQNSFGCRDGDITLVINGTTCAITSLASAIDVPRGVTDSTTVNLKDNSAIAAGVVASHANLACLGSWGAVTYAVNNGNLERNGTPSVAGIVNLQVQYGIAAAGLVNTNPNFNQVAQWVNAEGAWAAPILADRNRIKAIRIAVVARNDKLEGINVTNGCSGLDIPAPTGLCAWAGSATSPAPMINLSANDPSWARYRYRVFETMIPLRNVIWAKDTLSTPELLPPACQGPGCP